MKLRPSQRSALAERICQIWLKRRGLRKAAPKVYVIQRARGPGRVWGRCYHFKRIITLHIGPGAKKQDMMILLAHEFAHYLDFQTRRVGWKLQPHGDRFQILFWKILHRRHWQRAASGYWAEGPSAHRPEFQPD
jgi:predicted SprT family Zn-dependent metalloprotease